jgi:hypothetical protein
MDHGYFLYLLVIVLLIANGCSKLNSTLTLVLSIIKLNILPKVLHDERALNTDKQRWRHGKGLGEL